MLCSPERGTGAMKNMVETEEKYWRSKPLTEFAREEIEYVGKRKTPTMEVQVEDDKKPNGAPEAKQETKKEPEIGDAPGKISLPYSRLKEMLDLFNVVVTEAKFEFKPDGVEVIAVDPAHVAMLALKMPKSAFNEYHFDGELSTWAFDVEDWKKGIPKGSKNDLVSLERTKDRVVVSVGPFVKEYTLLDPSTVTRPRIPKIEAENSFTMGQYELRESFKGAEDVSDSIRFVLSRDGLIMKSIADSREFKADFQKDMIKEIVCADEEPVKSSYPLEYLLKLFKAMKTVDEVKTSFKNDYPLIAEFRLASGKVSDEQPEMKFLLAPRMEQ